MRYFALVMLLGLVPLAALGAEIQENVVYNGWKCVVLKNATTEAFIAPEIGGRLIQYQVDGQEWLWVNRDLAGKVYPVAENSNMEIWKNYGGDKLWPAPQGWDRPEQWPGPGDEVIEAPFTYEILKQSGPEVKLRIVGSGGGGWAGVQFIRELTLKDGDNKLTSIITMKNVSNRTVSWGIWEVAQMDWSDQGVKKGKEDWNEEAYLAIPMNPKSRWPERYREMFGQASSWNWQPDYDRNLMIVHYMNQVGKLNLDVSAGWAAMVDPQKGATYVQRFEGQDPKKIYPDGGNYEVWVAGKGEFLHKHKLRVAADDPKSRFVEMEIQGPKVTLKPGQSTTLTTSMEVVKGGLEAVPKK
jgi:hypothetical protein